MEILRVRTSWLQSWLQRQRLTGVSCGVRGRKGSTWSGDLVDLSVELLVLIGGVVGFLLGFHLTGYAIYNFYVL